MNASVNCAHAQRFNSTNQNRHLMAYSLQYDLKISSVNAVPALCMIVCTNVDVIVKSVNSHTTMIFKTITNISPTVNKQKCFGNYINYCRDAILELKTLLQKSGV